MKIHRTDYLVTFNFYVNGHSQTSQYSYCSEYDDVKLSEFIQRKIDALNLLDIQVFSYSVEKHDVTVLKQVILQHNYIGGIQLEI